MDDIEVFDRIIIVCLAITVIVALGQAAPPVRAMIALLGGA